MANVNGPYGFKPYQETLQVTPYYIESEYATALYIGDLVTLSGGYAIKATAGTDNSILGAIIGFENIDGTDGFAGYYPASTAGTWVALVADDVHQRFMAQDDGVGTAMDLLDIGKTGNFIATHSGSTTTNLSGLELDGSSFSGTGQAVTDQFRLIGLVGKSGNSAGANADWIVEIHNHYLRQENNVDATT